MTRRQNGSIWGVVLLIFGFIFLLTSIGYCQNSPRPYKSQNKTVYYDTTIKCTVLRIKTLFGAKKWLYHVPYFVLRYRKTETGQMDVTHLKYYYSNRVTRFRMVWYTDKPVVPPYDPSKEWDTVGTLILK